MREIVNNVMKCLFVAAILIAAYGVLYANMHGLASRLEPIVAVYIALGLLFALGLVLGSLISWLARRGQRDKQRAPVDVRESQSGNIFFALFGAIALVGVMGTVVTTVLKGPVSGMQRVTKYTVAENDMLAASVLVSRHSLSRENADCDGDGIIEPVAYAEGGEASPTGGGVIPPDVGVSALDPWGGAYGYCAWDHGERLKDEGCGGEEANRLRGGNTETGIAIAVISSGPDRVFQTTCEDWVDEAPDVNKPAGSDDIIRLMPYGSFLLPQASQARLEELPEEACTAQTIGMMRMSLGVVQICMDTGWTEVGTSAFSDSNFDPVTNAMLGQQYTSNSISFSGFLNQRDIEIVEGAAILVINGAPAGTSSTITAGDAIALRATAAPVPETTYTFALSVSGVRKSWTVRTRNFTPTQLSITPPSQSGTITTPGNPGYGSPISFIVRNIGEVETGPMLASQLSNATNFQFYSSGSHIGDGCSGRSLAYNGTCVIDVRPRASNDGAYNGTLTVRTGSVSAVANLSINATGWSCARPWGGTVAHGGSITAYQSASVSYGSNCASQTRSCSLGVLSGSYTHQTCTVQAASNCTSPWGATVNHNASVTAYQSSSVAYGGTCASQQRSCNNGSLSGSYTHQSCSVNAPSSCSRPWGGTVAHGASITAYQSASVPWGSSCASQSRACSNGSLSGSYIHQSCSVQSATYAYGTWVWGGCSASCGGGTQSATRSCIRQNDGASVACSHCGGACSTSQACNTHACPGYWVEVGLNFSTIPPACPAGTGNNVRCTPITHNIPTGSDQNVYTATSATCVVQTTVGGGTDTDGFVCNSHPKILCAYFNSIGLLPDHIYAADLRYAQQFVPDAV
ncbi:hypothetical protein [Aquamicrobium ahrensii]|uniref:Uncharacterized protein n=1 Tax=Aquamicrobium ahrensii TaxID=469551 RepID=A0ABV2KP43_9HYPH